MASTAGQDERQNADIANAQDRNESENNMNSLAQFAKKAGLPATDATPKTASCLESCVIKDGQVILTLSLAKYAEAKATTSGKEIYLNFTCPKQNVEIDGMTVGLRIAGNAFIGQAK